MHSIRVPLKKPYRAIVTERWQIDTETGKWKQKRKTIGYYESKKEALQALADYNKSPYDVDASKVTFQEVFERWSEEHFPTVSESNAKGYRAAYLLCEPIANKRMVDVKLDDLQYIADTSGKNTPTLRKYKVLVGLMFKMGIYLLCHPLPFVTYNFFDKSIINSGFSK